MMAFLDYRLEFSNLSRHFLRKMNRHNPFFLPRKLFTILLLSLVCISQVLSQENSRITIQGKILGEDQTPLPGVNIREKGTSNGTITDAEGLYKFEVSPEAVLVFSHIGYTSEEVPVNSNSVMEVVLTPDTKTLEEIIVMGYGIQEKKDVTGSAFALQSREFNKGIIYSPEQLIQGKIPGVDVSRNSGEPGSDSFIRIRGANTIRANNTPLYVIDGYPLDITSLDPPTWNKDDSRPYSPLLFLNPDDIESINVLKDASAAAIYGSRGSNGVIIITTKKGDRNGRNSLSYNSYFGFSELPQKIDVLSADEFRRAQQEYGFNQAFPDSTVNSDWQDEVFQTGFSQNHDLSFSGGTDISNFRASVNYFNQDGIIKSSYLKKYTGRINAHHLAINEKLSLEFNLAAGKTIHNQTGGKAATDALITNPTMPVYDTLGNLFVPFDNEENNPLFQLEKQENVVTTSKILTNLQANFEILEGFYVKLNGGLESAIATSRVNQDSKNTMGRMARIGEIESNSYLFESYLDWSEYFQENGSINLMAGYSFQQFQNRTFEFGAWNFDLEGARHVDMIRSGDFVDWIGQSSSHEQSKLQSIFARFIYNYNDRYLLTANYRMDGSSRFGDNYRYAHFPSIALGWRISNESFLINQSWIDNLKIRGSWGITGNQEIPNKISQLLVGSPYIQNLAGNSNAILDPTGQVIKGYTIVRTPNPDLQWEETEQWNIALDFQLFNQRLEGSLEYFYKNTENFLMEQGISGAPFRTMWVNVPGNLYNKGWEAFLLLTIIKTDFKWDISFSYTNLQNHIEGLSTPIPVGSYWGAEVFQQLMNGQPVGTFYGAQFLGFDENGNSVYVTPEETNYPINDVIGHGLPDFYGGISNEFSYKGFDLSFMFNGSYGNHVFATSRRYLEEKNKFAIGQNIRNDLLDNGESFSNTNIYSSRFVENGSFIRLNYLTFGYNFNVSKTSWLQYLRIYLSGNNLLLFTNYTGYDPEINILAKEPLFGVPPIGIDFGGYPNARSFQLGLNIQF